MQGRENDSMGNSKRATDVTVVRHGRPTVGHDIIQ